jgi:hypothetical protein
MMMVMPRVKSLSMAQCCKLVHPPISPTSLGIPYVLQELLPYSVLLQVYSLFHSTIFYDFASLTTLYNFSNALSSLILQKTFQNTESFWNVTILNGKKFDNYSLLPFFSFTI